jgi:hypothetical protein
MIDLLKDYYVPYINNLKPIEPKLNPTYLTIKYEDINESEFDIIDKKVQIRQDFKTGSASYHNANFELRFIDYEHLLNQFPIKLQKGIKRCDFIVYDLNGNSIFILNELSQSASAQTKLSDAIEQLYHTALHLTRVEQIKAFINSKEKLHCIFSNRSSKVNNSPLGMADSFNLIQEILPEPILHTNDRINKLGFELIETDQIYIK